MTQGLILHLWINYKAAAQPLGLPYFLLHHQFLQALQAHFKTRKIKTNE